MVVKKRQHETPTARRTRKPPLPTARNRQAGIDFLRSRLALDDPTFRELRARAKASAFWMAQIADARLTQDVLTSLAHAVKRGESLADWKARIGPLLRSVWGAGARDAAGRVFHQGARVELIFRNASARAFNSGRYLSMSLPDAMAKFPAWMYEAVIDDATTALCRSLHGTIRPAGDPWFETRVPPSHHSCRSVLRPLTAREAERRGGVTALPPPDHGEGAFGLSPRQAARLFEEAELGALDEDLRRRFEAKRRRFEQRG